MRTALLLSLIVLAGCSKRTPAPLSAGDLPQSLPIAPEPHEPSFVPQDAGNLRQLERIRREWPPCIERDLALGQFKYGGRIEEVVAAHRPDALLTHDDYMTAVYAGGHLIGSYGFTQVVAKNGKLVQSSGSSCIWRAVFFDGLSKEERTKWYDSFEKALKAHIVTIPTPYNRQRAAIGVAGPAAVLNPTPIEKPIPAPREVNSAPHR